ncbi:hypothetical protein GCM10023257_33050 [Streptomyces hyderabadensis]|uniref:Uncharacterized protein n=1 Tax=Streptomyces hyderabadensis TaxID=598549 RepID=A0ABP9I6M9_9ACTN
MDIGVGSPGLRDGEGNSVGGGGLGRRKEVRPRRFPGLAHVAQVHDPAVGALPDPAHVPGALRPVHAGRHRVRGQRQVLARPPRRHGLARVQGGGERPDVGGVQAVAAGETVHEAVDLAVHPPQRCGEDVRAARLGAGAAGPPLVRVLSAPVRCRHVISV